MNLSEFNYYIHRTPVADYTQFFNNGLIDYDRTFRIESTMERISDQDIAEGRLQDKMTDLREGDENVFLIKIPKAYFPNIVHRDGSMDIPIPFFRDIQTTDEYGRENVYPLLIPNLIQGCYNKQKGFITNPNYCPVFDPSGLKFAYEQIQPMRDNGYYKYTEYSKRNSGSVADLFKFDQSNKTWGSFIEYYSRKFDVTSPAVVFNNDEQQQLIGSNKHV